MTNEKKLEVIEDAFNYYHDRTSLNNKEEKELLLLVNEIKEAINYTPCCETVKEKCTHTFEVDPKQFNSAYDRCNEITKILKAPSKIYLYDGENYIELKP
jgi:hypothetical protein